MLVLTQAKERTYTTEHLLCVFELRKEGEMVLNVILFEHFIHFVIFLNILRMGRMKRTKLFKLNIYGIKYLDSIDYY